MESPSIRESIARATGHVTAHPAQPPDLGAPHTTGWPEGSAAARSRRAGRRDGALRGGVRRTVACAVVAALLLCVAPGLAAAQGARVALVIGNGAYGRGVPALANPARDARAVAEALVRLGFQTQLLLDGGRGAMRDAVRWLEGAAVGAEAAVLFYAGHAAEVGGRNLLFPVSIGLGHGGAGLLEEALPFDEIDAALSGKARTTVIILDACRDNPFAGQAVPAEPRAAAGRRGRAAAEAPAAGGTRSVGTGLAGVSSGSGMLAAFATAPGQVALDGDDEHSPFTRALLRHIETPDVDVREMLGAVRRSVREATGGRQIPWDNSSLEARFILRSALGAGAAIGPTRRTRSDAAARGVPMPPDLEALRFNRPADPRLARLVGSWTSGEERWGAGSGRHTNLLVLDVNPAEGTATIVYGTGPPHPNSYYPNVPAWWARRVGRVLRDGSIEWRNQDGVAFLFAPTGPDTLIGRMTTPPDFRPPNRTIRITLRRIE